MKFYFAAIIFGTTILTANCGFFHAKSETSNAKSNSNSKQSANYKEPRRLATLKNNDIKESSGLAASSKNAGAFWTLNDSGDGAFLYAFDKTGKNLGVWRVTDANNADWEDLAIFNDSQTGESWLLIGDIGDNERQREELVIYKISEPLISSSDADSSKKNPRSTEKAEAVRVSYPKGKQDAETLVVNPANGDLYIIGKTLEGAAGVYKLSAPFSNGVKLVRVGEIAVPGPSKGFLTGGAIAPDGKRLILCDYFAGYEFTLPAASKNFDEIWKTVGTQIQLGERAQGEAVTYGADGRAVYSTSEKRPAPLNEIQRK